MALSCYGRSVGHWEGDTLQVDTVGIKPSIPGYQGMPQPAKKCVIASASSWWRPITCTIRSRSNDPVVLENARHTYTGLQTPARL